MKKIPWLIILILIAVIIFQRSCSNCDCPEFEVITEKVIVPGDSVIIEKEVPVPEPYYISSPPDTVTEYLYHEVDTGRILANYFLKRFYQDTLKDDSSAFIRHDFTIYRNRMTKSKLFFQNRRAKTVLKQELRPNAERKAKFYGGLAIGRKYNEFGAGLSLALSTKKDDLYTLTYDVINKDVYFSVFWKVRFKKPDLLTFPGM